MESYKTQEMHPMKFNRNHIGPKPRGINMPNSKYNGFGCINCQNNKKCPIEAKSYHAQESFYDLYVNGNNAYSVAAWCMGSNGINKFEVDWDYFLNEDEIKKEMRQELINLLNSNEPGNEI